MPLLKTLTVTPANWLGVLSTRPSIRPSTPLKEKVKSRAEAAYGANSEPVATLRATRAEPANAWLFIGLSE